MNHIKYHIKGGGERFIHEASTIHEGEYSFPVAPFQYDL